MATDTAEQKVKSGRTPSMLASATVMVVLIGLIAMAIFLFGEEVDGGPLQISITLATLFALTVAYYYGHRGALINTAISQGISAALGTIFVLLAIGAFIGSLYLAGTVAAIIHYGVQLVSPSFFYSFVFVLATTLSVLVGSSFTTVGVVGVAFVGLSPVMGVSPAITAGAAVAGAFTGDKVAKISDTFLLAIAVVGGLTPAEHSRMITRTLIIPWLVSAVLFILLGFTEASSAGNLDVVAVQSAVGEIFNVSLIAFLPLISVFVLSKLDFSGFESLLYSALLAVLIAAITQPAIIIGAAQDPNLNYLGAVVKVSLETLAAGFHLDSGAAEMNTIFSGGGTWSMFETVWVILIAAAFGAIVDYTGMIHQIVAPVIRWSKDGSRLIFATILSIAGMNVLTADPYVSIVLTGRSFRKGFIEQKLKPVVLSTSIADGGSIVSPIIPWNVHGAFMAGALGVSVVAFAPFAFLCYLQPLTTIVLGVFFMRRDRLPRDEDADEVYGQEPEQLPEPHLSA